MAETVVELFKIFKYLKELSDNVEGNKSKCKELITLCISFEESLNMLEKSSVEIKASSLSELLDVTKACFKYCEKYTGESWIFKALLFFEGKDEFDELKTKLLSISHSLHFNLASRIVITQHEAIEINRKEKEETHRLLKGIIISYNIKAKREDELREKLREAARLGSEIVEAVDGLDSSTPVSSINASDSTFLEDLDLSNLLWSEDTSERLGEGGFSVVYKGIYQRKDCAVKHLRLGGTPTAEELSKVKKEARVASLVKHKNLVEFFGCSMSKKVLLFELAACSVHDVLYGKKELTVRKSGMPTAETLKSFDTALLLFKDIFCGVMFLHSHGIIHRDIKSSNILLVHAEQNEKGFIGKISDFGLATSNTFTTSASLTKHSRAVGSDAYLAPELLDFDGIPPYSFASDTYALGITINEILTCERPFSGLKIIQIGIQVLTKKSRPKLFSPDQTKAEERILSGLLGNNESGLLHQNPCGRPTALSCLAPFQEDNFTFQQIETLMDILKLGISVNETTKEEEKIVIHDHNQIKMLESRESAILEKIVADDKIPSNEDNRLVEDLPNRNQSINLEDENKEAENISASYLVEEPSLMTIKAAENIQHRENGNEADNHSVIAQVNNLFVDGIREEEIKDEELIQMVKYFMEKHYVESQDLCTQILKRSASPNSNIEMQLFDLRIKYHIYCEEQCKNKIALMKSLRNLKQKVLDLISLCTASPRTTLELESFLLWIQFRIDSRINDEKTEIHFKKLAEMKVEVSPNAYLQCAHFLLELGRENAMQLLKIAERVASERKDWDGLYRAYCYQGDYFYNRDVNCAIEKYKKAEKVIEEHSYLSSGWAFQKLSKCYSNLSEMKSPLAAQGGL